MIFSWTKDTPNLPVVDDDEKVARQGVLMIQMIDSALDMIGPDTDALTEILLELGSKHESYGVEPHMYQMMQLALCDAMEDILGTDVMTHQVKHSWSLLMAALADEMMTTQDVSWRAGAFEDH
jgi:hemoglobin-like flavoprotein